MCPEIFAMSIGAMDGATEAAIISQGRAEASANIQRVREEYRALGWALRQRPTINYSIEAASAQ
jgi:hypothetical protein